MSHIMVNSSIFDGRIPLQALFGIASTRAHYWAVGSGIESRLRLCGGVLYVKAVLWHLLNALKVTLR